MFMKFVRGAVASAVLVAMSLTAASAVTLTFNNNGGNGTFTPTGAPGFTDSFTVVSNNNGVSNINTVYGGTTGNETAVVTFNWFYFTFDRDDSSYDPLGYVVGAVYTALSATLPSPALQSGTFAFNVPANTFFGWVLGSTDGILGAATAGIRANIVTTPVPLPAGGLLLIGALGGFAALRRRKAASLV
jgi:hypothetical protein